MGDFRAFIATKRTEQTRRTYDYGARLLVGDPDAFLEAARADRRRAEETLIEYLVKNRDILSSSTLHTRLFALKSFLDYEEVPLSWKRVSSVMLPVRKAANDRAPSREEIRALIRDADRRVKVAALLMASGGFRVGSFDTLLLGDFAERPSGLGTLAIYRGTVYEYAALVTPEAVQALKSYLEYRREVCHERLSPDSPLVRDRWVYTPTVHHIQGEAIKEFLQLAWRNANVKQVGEFKCSHGFRKFFKTHATKAIGKTEVVECLMGHKVSYFRPTLEELEEDYLKAVPELTISELAEVKQEKTVLETDYKDRSERLEGRLAISELRNQQMATDFEEFKAFMADQRRKEQLRRELGQLDNSAK